MWRFAVSSCALYCLVQIVPLLCTDLNGTDLLYPIAERNICVGLDIRNNIKSFKQLEGCQVIEGSLQIFLFDVVNETELASLSFPDLVEITGYLALFRVNGLKSVGQLFPNLTVIRGMETFLRNALVIYEMSSLQEIGLYSLTKILNGGIHIDKNPNLCFVDSIDWSKIADNNDPLENKFFIKSYKPENECPVCPATTVNGRNCPKVDKTDKFYCWNRDHCQTICPTTCTNSSCNGVGVCCNERCVGGCDDGGTKCKVCKEFAFISEQDNTTKCVKACPSNYLSFLDRRCVTRDECIFMHKRRGQDLNENDAGRDHPNDFYKIHNGTCLSECPSKYTGNFSDHVCRPCNNTCTKTCAGGKIDTLNRAHKFKGCTHITGSLEISIRGGNQVVRSLQENLEMIEEIDGYLKIARSFSLVSLNFFKNLKRIRGNELDSAHYSLTVSDNQNLEDLFDRHATVKIERGKLFFHFNPKLCIEKIEKLRIEAGLDEHSQLDVAANSNGDKVACNIKHLDVKISNVSSKSAILTWPAFEMDDPRKLLSYTVYTIATRWRNVSFYDGRDACIQDMWHTAEVPNDYDAQTLSHTIDGLVPYTQYAYFVKTYTIASEKNGAQSGIEYFMTKAGQPSEPKRVRSDDSQSNSLNVTWKPPIHPNGVLSHYIVTMTKMLDQRVEDRDYCVNTVTSAVDSKGTKQETDKSANDVCKNGKGDGKIRNEEAEEEARIDFENALINKAYIKTTGRSRRDAAPNNRHYTNETIRGIVRKNYTTEKNSRFYNFLEYHVNASLNWILLQPLRHYTGFIVNVKACRKYEGANDDEDLCSIAAVETVRTKYEAGADDIYNVTIVNITSESVTIRWLPPQDPNKKIVAIKILYKRENSKNSQYIPECFMDSEFSKHYTKDGKHMEYTISKLFPGNHSLYLTTSSLAAFGNSSKIYFVIPENEPSNVFMAFLILFVVSSIVVFLFWFLYRRTLREKFAMRLIPAVNPEYMQSVYVVDEWEVPRKNVELIKELGQGSFGMVWEGIGYNFKGHEGPMRCAVKTVNEHATSRERVEFLNEASVMKAFNTAHVVKLLGVVSQGQPALVVMELMVNGDLKSYLRSHRPENNDGKAPPSLKQILQMAIEIADGMAYLEGKKFVHRDLAARNCMVAEDLTVKIGDFGMTRDIYETDYYRKGSRGLLPVRWMSPESLKDGVFSSSSDAWSYGVVLWEMATLASQPYQGLSNEQVLRYIMEGGLMERPENCPDKLYEIMRLCWDLKPGKRPSFTSLCEMLLPDANERFVSVSYFNSPEGIEARSAKTNGNAINYEFINGDVIDDVDASTPLNPLPPDVRLGGAYAMSASERSDSIQSIHLDPNPRFYSISEERVVNGFAGGARMRNGKAYSQC